MKFDDMPDSLIERCLTDHRTHFFFWKTPFVVGDYSGEPMKCGICKGPTHFVETNFGAPFCSDECVKRAWLEFIRVIAAKAKRAKRRKKAMELCHSKKDANKSVDNKLVEFKMPYKPNTTGDNKCIK